MSATVVAVGAILFPACATQPPLTAPSQPPSTFVSVRIGFDDRQRPCNEGSKGPCHDAVVLSDPNTGQILKVIHDLPWDGMQVSGLALARDGRLWVSLGSGPACTSGVAGCGPRPYTCRSRVLELDLVRGTTKSILRGGDDELIAAAEPSPTGRSVAYLHSGCATSYFNDSIRIEDLDTGRTESIAAALPRCHGLGPPHWTADARHLVFTYSAASDGLYSGAAGTCSMPEPSVIETVDATRSQPKVTGSAVAADPDCEISDARPMKSGYLALESCGGQNFDGPLRILRFDAGLRITSRRSIGRCGSGEVSLDRAMQHALITTYQYCGGLRTADPITRVFVEKNGDPKLTFSVPGGDLNPSSIAW